MQWINPDRLSLIIQSLDDTRFAALVNRLLSETVARHGIPRECLALNLRTKEPDGGIDARCVDAPTTVGRLIPRSSTDYQYKSGQGAKSIPKLVTDDIKGQPRVLAGLRAGHAFVYISAWDRGDRTDEALVEAARSDGIEVDDGQFLFISRETLAHIMGQYPALVAEFLGISYDGLVTLAGWSSWMALSNPFQTDEAVASQLADLRARVEIPASMVRVVGAAGDGKTRLVLETLRSSSLGDTVLYARQVDEVTASFKSYLVRTPDVHCTLVVDEVDDEAAERLADDFANRPAGVRLVLIGLDAAGHSQANTLQVAGLSDELLARTIQAITPGLSDDVANTVAGDCRHSPKLAVLIAGWINAHPELGVAQALKDGDVRSRLDRYLRGLKSSDPQWSALSAMSLLMRVGWSGELEDESTRIFSALGLDPTTARRYVEALHTRHGIAPSAGRLRYISPAILGDHLAAREMEAWTRDQLTKFLTALTPPMVDSFVRRARRLSAALKNRAIVEEVILGDQGPFRSLAELENGGLSFILRHLAAPFPRATLSALERCIGDASTEALKSATHSRRDIVWALEQLLWPAETFERASRQLLRLAVAENETWANNASSYWRETFQTHLGRTAAGPEARLRSVRYAASLSEPAGRILAAQAVRSAFRTHHIVRTGNPPSDVEGMPSTEWRPATYGEWFDSLVSYLDIMEPLTTDADPSVAAAAVDVLGEIGGDLFRVNERVLNRWAAVARNLRHDDTLLRGRLSTSIDAVCEGWERRRELRNTQSDDQGASSEDLEEEEMAFIDVRLRALRALQRELEGDDFGSILRVALARDSRRILSESSGGPDADTELLKLAERAIAQPDLLGRQWAWLLEDKAWSRAERWIDLIGGLDSKRIAEPELKKLSEESPRAAQWRTIYDLAFARAGAGEAWIDSRAASLEASGEPRQAFDLLLRAGYSATRLERIMNLLVTRQVPTQWLGQLTFSPWVREMSSAEVRGLANAALDALASSTDVLPFLGGYLTYRKSATAELESLLLRLLRDSAHERDYRHAAFNWDSVAKQLVAGAPLEVADAVLQRIVALELSYHDDELTGVLRLAWTHGDKDRLFREIISPVLEDDSVGAWWARKAIATLPLLELGADVLMQWVQEAPTPRGRIMAEVMGAPSAVASEVHARLLKMYADQGVSSVFFGSLISGVFMGSETVWTHGKLEQARRWLSDPRPEIRDWAAGVVSELEAMVAHAETREAEEPFRH